VSSILDNFEVGKRALMAQTSVLNTVGHNLANAGTPGYTRQRAELAPVRTQNGVEVTSIIRIRDRYLDFSVMTESQNLGRDQAQQGLLQRLEAAFNDPPGTGLSSTLDQFFQGFQALAVNPSDQALRVTVRDDGEHVASAIQDLAGRIAQVKTDLTTQIQGDVTKVNGLLTQIAELHRQILASGGGPTPNDLLDKRDQLVDQLNQVIGVTATDRPDGTLQLAVTGTGILLVDGTLTAPLTATLNPVTDSIDLTAGAIAVTPQSGELGAAVAARNSPTGPVKQAASDVDSLARTIIAEVNRLHASGTGLTEHTSLTALSAVSSSSAPLTAAGLAFTPVSGSFDVIVHDAAGAVASRVTVPVTAGVTSLDDIAAAIGANPDLSATVSGGQLTIAAASGKTFTFANDTSDTLMALGLNVFFTGSGAGDIALNPMIAADANTIAAARADANGLVHAGDGANALALGQLPSQLTMGGGTATFSDFFGTAVGRIGSLASQANDAVDRQGAALQAVQSLQQQTSAVSTDEEMIALSQAQNAYAAAAKYIGTVQTMIQSLLDMMS
jgi:flagellar hook-associated protein 1 FlgK